MAEKLYSQPLLITPARHAAFCQILETRMAQTTNVIVTTGSKQASPVDDDSEDDMRGASDDPTGKLVMGDTAIISVHGPIVQFPDDVPPSECWCDLETLNMAIDSAEADSNIRRVIYDFRTPGGSVTGIPETGRKIRLSNKKTVAFTQSECCSGGIWLAAQCEEFYATPSSSVGSVGVYMMCLDYSAMMKKEGIKVNAISAGKYKLLGAYFRAMSDDERAQLQKGVDRIYGQFLEAMESQGRQVSVEKFGNGLVYDGDEAAELGFTNGTVECLEDVLEMSD